MAKNILERMFNKQPTTAAEDQSVNNSTIATQANDGLTGVARYLLKQQAAEQTAAEQQQSQQAPAEKPPTTVAKYIDNIKKPELTGVARYLVKQIIPEYQKRAEAAAKAAAPTGVERYIAKVTAAAAELQPAVPTGVENYLKKIG